ncbi:hypothetical protein CRUP_002192 [Coryphaenoides rupestris]|nr:hypothetical protein CRUP_002192 [Coryphaenoides rupestris]
MKINHHSPLYKSLTSNEGEAESGFLTSLLTHLADHCGNKQCSDADTQTSSLGTYRESLVDKMKMIDQEYESLHHMGGKWTSYENKLAAYKRELETQMHAEINIKLQHFKEVEMAKMRLEEKARSNKEFANFRQELEKTYEMKADCLMNREKNAIDRLQKQQKIEENNVYMQRQTLLKEIEKVRNRDNELKLRMEGFEKMCEIHTDKVKAMEDLLRRRELAVKTSEDTYDQKLHNELSRYKLELKEEFIKRTEQLTENESRNKGNQHLHSLLQQQQHHEYKETTLLQCAALEVSEQQAALLGQQRELLSERLEAVSDYSALKREKAELQAQLRLVGRQLEEMQEENRLLRADAGRPSTEQLSLQAELQRLQGARHAEQAEFEEQRQVLQAQLQGEAERCAHLQAQLMESEEKSHWLGTHAEEMKLQLRQTQQALENEVLRNPKPSLVDRSVLELSGGGPLVPPDIYVQGPLPTRALLLGSYYDDAAAGGGGGGGLCEAGGTTALLLRGGGGRALPRRWAPSSLLPGPEEEEEEEKERETDLLLAGAKARIRDLEREAETLEEAYRNYQQRALRGAITHMLPASPLPYSPPPPRRKSPVTHYSRPPSPRKSQVSGRPFYPPPPPRQQQQHVSHHTRTTSPSQSPDPESIMMCPRPRATSVDRTPLLRPTADLAEDSRDLQALTLALAKPPISVTRPRSPSCALSPSRRLSSTPLSATSTQKAPQMERTEGRSLPSAGDFSPDLGSPHGPQLQSTAREHQSSPSSGHPAFSSSGSSPLPEEIHLEDLSTTLLPPDEAPRCPGQSAEGEHCEEEERWERERKVRQARRQREREEGRERELEELTRLERQTTLLEVKNTEKSDGEEEDEAMGGVKSSKDECDEEEEGGGGGGGGTKSPGAGEENPLEKYMKVVLEAREKQQPAQSPARAAAASPDAGSLSERESVNDERSVQTVFDWKLL